MNSDLSERPGEKFRGRRREVHGTHQQEREFNFLNFFENKYYLISIRRAGNAKYMYCVLQPDIQK
jgi:hypothetical protein